MVSKRKRVTAFLLTCTLISAALSSCGGSTAASSGSTGSAEISTKHEMEVETMALTNLSTFDMTEVTQLDSYCENALKLEVMYLLTFDNDKLLAGFRETAGLDMKGTTRYGGWENSLIGGHTMGHYLSALAQAAVNPGVSEEDRAELTEKLNTIISELLICQENSKGKPGYVFGATLIDPSNVELQFDNVEKGQANITNQAWVPWYTMHKLLAGTIEVYELTGNEDALTLARGIGDWTYGRTSSWNDATNRTVLSIEYGGMNDALYELYAVTGEEKYAVAAHAFDEDVIFKKVLSGTENSLNDRHANTTIPKFLGALNRYYTTNGKVIEGETVDAGAYLEYAEAFWETVTERHTYVTGGNSEWEHFGKDFILDAERTNCNNETCNVYNMLKLSRKLFEITGDKKYADYYETAFINSILSSQNPETGMTTYFQPMATGYFKVYSSDFSSFWCCTGSGMENFTKLNDSIYFHNEDNVVVNLYFSSVLNWQEKNVTITQTADLNTSDTVSLLVETTDGSDAEIGLMLRIPDWAQNQQITVSVNGEAYDYMEKDGYALIPGSFASGTEITVMLPMTLAAYALPDNEAAIAFKYGPYVLSADLGTEDEVTTTTGVSVTIPAKKIVETETILLPNGITRKDLNDNPSSCLTKLEKSDGIEFSLSGTDLVFAPHYLRYQERYGIYFFYKTEDEAAAETLALKQSKDETLDTVQPGYGQYENDELHAMTEVDSVSVTDDGTYRYANAGGSFTYRMSINPEGENYLSLTLRKEDNGKQLVISAGATADTKEVIFQDTLDYIGLESDYELRVQIPAELAANAEEITANGETHKVIYITFSGSDTEESAKVCNFIYMLDVTKLYVPDETVAYFVDCGDYLPTTVSDGDAFGVYNSVTEQLYGYDPVTGKKWGLIDDADDQYGGEGTGNGGLYTAHTWAYEFNDAKTDVNKTASNRYTKNQYEDGYTTRFLDYAFELPDGTYTVEIGFANPWNCSNKHDVFFDLGTEHEQQVASAYNVADGPLTADAVVKDGKLTINFRNDTTSGLAINVTYIKISFKN